MVEAGVGRPGPEYQKPLQARIIKQKKPEAAKDRYRGLQSKPEPHNEVPEPDKVRKVRREAPPLWRERAEFTKQTADFLRRCDVDPNYVNPMPLGEGFYHVVFEYIAPDGSNKVIKIPKATRRGYMSSGVSEDLENGKLLKRFFGSYAVQSEVRMDEATGNHLFIQDMVRGKTLTSNLETPEIRAQLVDMARLNREMMRQTGASFDFIGVAGFMSWARHQVRAVLTKTSEFEVTNIVIDEHGKLKIIDEGLLRFRDVPVKQRAISNLGFLSNRLIMRLYFGVDLLPDPESPPTA